MQVTPNIMVSPALATATITNTPPQNEMSGSTQREIEQPYRVIVNDFNAPSKADPQSVVQAQIKGSEQIPDTQKEAAAARALEQKAQATARTKSIMGLLPAGPSEVTKLMSALAAATSAEAIADIKLDAQPVLT